MNNKRHQFLRWLMYKVFKQREGEVPNKFLKILHNIICPIEQYLSKSIMLRYDWDANVIWIEGQKYSPEVFDFFRIKAKEGQIFRFVERKDGVIQIEPIIPKTTVGLHARIPGQKDSWGKDNQAQITIDKPDETIKGTNPLDIKDMYKDDGFPGDPNRREGFEG